jgi:hypothetical protein
MACSAMMTGDFSGGQSLERQRDAAPPYKSRGRWYGLPWLWGWIYSSVSGRLTDELDSSMSVEKMCPISHRNFPILFLFSPLYSRRLGVTWKAPNCALRDTSDSMAKIKQRVQSNGQEMKGNVA